MPTYTCSLNHSRDLQHVTQVICAGNVHKPTQLQKHLSVVLLLKMPISAAFGLLPVATRFATFFLIDPLSLLVVLSLFQIRLLQMTRQHTFDRRQVMTKPVCKKLFFISLLILFVHNMGVYLHQNYSSRITQKTFILIQCMFLCLPEPVGYTWKMDILVHTFDPRLVLVVGGSWVGGVEHEYMMTRSASGNGQQVQHQTTRPLIHLRKKVLSLATSASNSNHRRTDFEVWCRVTWTDQNSSHHLTVVNTREFFSLCVYPVICKDLLTEDIATITLCATLSTRLYFETKVRTWLPSILLPS